MTQKCLNICGRSLGLACIVLIAAWTLFASEINLLRSSSREQLGTAAGARADSVPRPGAWARGGAATLVQLANGEDEGQSEEGSSAAEPDAEERDGETNGDVTDTLEEENVAVEKRRPETVAVEKPQPALGKVAVLDPRAVLPPADARTLTVVMASSYTKNLDLLVVAINSAATNCKAGRLSFRLLVRQKDAAGIGAQLHHIFPDLDIRMVAFDPWIPRVSHLLGGKSTSRKDLDDPFNWAAFFLHEVFPSVARLLYLDTDIVVQADIVSELLNFDLGEHSSGVVRDCSQNINKYLFFGKIKAKAVQKTLPRPLHAKSSDCVTNRGVLLMDTRRWARAGITEEIEAYVAAHLSKDTGPLWRAGSSQPPFLLAIAGRFTDLGIYYNVRGLGRVNMDTFDVTYYEKQGLWHEHFNDYLLKCKDKFCMVPGSYAPYISSYAHQAKILHYNGKVKPNKNGNKTMQPIAPLKGLTGDAYKKAQRIPLCSCGSTCLVDCAALWWKYWPERAGTPGR